MKLSLHAVGRMKNGPERELYQRYFDRAVSTGKPHGVTSFTLKEYPESKAPRPAERMAQEADGILKNIDDKAHVIALDERGKTMTSPDFAKMIGNLCDGGMSELVLIIGGADGLDAKIRARADRLIAFGAMTWPHQIVRVLVVEQIYRSFSILSGHPYHKV